LAVVEGVRLVEEALEAQVRFRGSLVSPELTRSDRGAALLARLAAHAVPIEEVPAREFASLAATETPQGVIGIIRPPRWSLSEVIPGPGRPALVLDEVQDPGNVGVLLRTAFGLGASGAVLLKGCADLWNPKALRASMGASLRFPAVETTMAELADWQREHGVELWAADTSGTPLGRTVPPERLAIAVGNEGAGISPAIATLAAQHVCIPLARGADSLNVAVAAGILLHEVRRAH